MEGRYAAIEACRVLADDVASEAVLRDSSTLKGFSQQSGMRMVIVRDDKIWQARGGV